MSELGNLYLEIIQPISGSSPYAEFLQEHGEGIHHLAIRQNDRFVPLMQERGNEEIFSVWIGESFTHIMIHAKTWALSRKHSNHTLT